MFEYEETQPIGWGVSEKKERGREEGEKTNLELSLHFMEFLNMISSPHQVLGHNLDSSLG